MNDGQGTAGDRGAALILALITITVVAVGVAALLSLADTSVVATETLRTQAAAAYAADGAGQAAINGLRTDTFNGTSGSCITSGAAWQLPNFYPGANGSTASSAYVACTPDSGNGTGGSSTAANASPGSAILTLGTGAGGEDGIHVSSNAGPVPIRGGIFSNSTINVGQGGIANTYNHPPSVPYTIARGTCANPTLITPTQYIQCGYTAVDQRGSDPGTLTPHGASYDPPSAPTGDGTVAPCTPGATHQTLAPGRYTSVAALNGLTGCLTGIVVFTPGTYYFDFQDPGVDHDWVVDRTYVIAGTPTIPLTVTPTPALMPTACVAPSDPAATASSGVLFVFGGDSRLTLSHHGNPGGQVAICASASPSGPPIAVYGLKSALGGSHPVSAESGCVTNVPPATTCPVIYTDQSPDTTLTIQGTTYTARALISISLNNNANQVFRWGLITRSLSVQATGSVDLSMPLVDVPDVAANPTPNPNIVYLAVYVCEQSSTCGTSGKLRLRAKVQLSATTPRAVTVLSWSTQR